MKKANKELEQKMRVLKAAEDELIAKISIIGSDELFEAVEKWKRAGEAFWAGIKTVELVANDDEPKDYTTIKKVGAAIGIVGIFTLFACGATQAFYGDWLYGLVIVGVIGACGFALFLIALFMCLWDYFFNG